MLYSKVILSSLLFLPAGEIENIEGLRSELTVTPKYSDAPIELFRETPRWFGVPLFHFRVPPAKKIEDRRIEFPIEMEFRGKLRLQQAKLYSDFNGYVALQGKTGFILEAKPGFGKCHGKGTKIFMYNGFFKEVEKIKAGDLLMGPDSKPRLVKTTSHGCGKMYRVTPINGKSFTCNEDHILSVMISNGLYGRKESKRKTRPVLLSVKEWLGKSKAFKHHTKLWKANISFPDRRVIFDPYLVGLYLGDGSKRGACVTVGNGDKEISAYLQNWAGRNRHWIRKEQGHGCRMFHFSKGSFEPSNLIIGIRRLVCGSGEKRIPKEYFLNSERKRLEVLSGILDADGSLAAKTVYDLTLKGKLAQDVVVLARSLGFRVKESPCEKSCRVFVGKYTRITISGNTNRIPCRLARRRARVRKQRKDWRVSGFEIEPIPDDYYYGFTLSGDGLYLLEDFTVTHNTVMAIAFMHVVRQRTLVVVPRSNLIKQWKERLLKFSNLKPYEIGWIEGGKGEWAGKKVVVGLVHSLVLNRLGDNFKKNFGCVIFDEVDRSVPPQTFAPAVAMFPAKYRIGMSATLKRQDGMEVVFQKHIGEVFMNGGDEGRMKPKVLIHHFIPSSGFVYPGSQRLNRRGMLLSRLAGNQLRNRVVANYTHLIWKSGRQCLVLSDRKKQLISIYWELAKHFKIPEKEIGYYVRSLGKKQFSHSERAKVAIACKILLGTYGMIQLGTDIKSLAGLVYATPQSETEQSSGRIEREMEGKKQPVVVDIVDVAYSDCVRWALKRKRWYKSQGLEVKTVA